MDLQVSSGPSTGKRAGAGVAVGIALDNLAMGIGLASCIAMGALSRKKES